MKARPYLLLTILVAVLLPELWLAARLAGDIPGIVSLCRAATWYEPTRCDVARVLTRGLLALAIPGAMLGALAAWILAGRSAHAHRWRGTTAWQERMLATNARVALRRVPPSHWVAIAALTLLAVAYRLPMLGLPMRSDENQTLLLYSGRSLEAALWQFDTTNNHLFFSILARAAIALFGAGPAVARLPEFLCGVLLVPATALALRSLRSPPAALLAAAVVAGLPYLVAFSGNGRGYSVVALLFVLAIPVAIELSLRADAALWSCFVLLASLALFTNPTAVYPFGAAGMWIFARRLAIPDRPIGDVLLGGAVIGLASWALYAPALTAMGTEALFANPWMRPPAWGEFLSTFGVALDGTLRELWWQWGWGLPAWVVALVTASLAVGLEMDARRGWRARGLLLVLFLWTGIVAVASHRLPYIRVLLPYLPVLLVAGAGAVITILRRFGLRTSDPSGAWAVAAVVVALALGVVRGSAREVYMTRAQRGATVSGRVILFADARPCLLGNRPAPHGAGPHPRARAPRGHARNT